MPATDDRLAADCAGLPYYDELHDYEQITPTDFGKDDGTVYTLKHIERCTKCGCKREMATIHHREDDDGKR